MHHDHGEGGTIEVNGISLHVDGHGSSVPGRAARGIPTFVGWHPPPAHDDADLARVAHVLLAVL